MKNGNTDQAHAQTRLVAANAIELGSRIIKNLGGGVLNGNEMDDLKDTMAIQLNNSLEKRRG